MKKRTESSGSVIILLSFLYSYAFKSAKVRPSDKILCISNCPLPINVHPQERRHAKHVRRRISFMLIHKLTIWMRYSSLHLATPRHVKMVM